MVWASRGATIRSTASSPRARARSPARRPMTRAPTAPPPRWRGSARVYGTLNPLVATTSSSMWTAAYGSSNASRTAWSAAAASSPRWSASSVAANSGSGRSPNSSRSTTPRSRWRSGCSANPSNRHRITVAGIPTGRWAASSITETVAIPTPMPSQPKYCA